MTKGLASVLIAEVGTNQVITDPDDLTYYASDIYSTGTIPVAVFVPIDVASLQRGVRTITRNGGTIVPRGGGVSYTGGTTPSEPRAVVVDTSAMTRITEVNASDMYVTVEAGCTWADLRTTLAKADLRTPFWGPLSGAYATVGGTVSQGAVLWGSNRYGTSGESVVGLEVVLADGTLLKTGMASIAGAQPGWRHFGPDFTGLFLGDAGAMGVKATVTLRLMRIPSVAGYRSFSFTNRHDLLDAMAEIARSGLTTTGFALDPVLTDQRIRRGSIAQGAEAVRSMIADSSNKLNALREAARIAVRGRGLADRGVFTFHMVAEGRSPEAVKADLAAIDAICHNGVALDDTVPRLLSSRPFGSLTSALGPEGQRWAPLHVLVPLSKAADTWDRIDSLFEKRRKEIDSNQVEIGMMASTISATSFLLEAVMTWPGPLTEFHRRNIDAGKLRRYPRYPESQEIKDLVTTLRDELVHLFADVGGAHFQIGRRYRYLDRLDDPTRLLLKALKRHLDHEGQMNPGSLGLGADIEVEHEAPAFPRTEREAK